MKIIDVHSHFIIPEYMQSLLSHHREMEDGFPAPTWSIEEHLAYMDMACIDKSLISVSSPHFHSGDGAEAIALGKLMDEQAAAYKRQHPDRIMFAAALPVPEIEASIDAVNYAYDVLGADAVKLPSNACGLYPGDAKYEPLFKVLNERNAVVILHPAAPAEVPQGCFTAGPLPLFEFIADTTRAVINLITSGTLERYPDIRVIVPHCGSFLPNIIDRLTGITKVLASKGVGKPVEVKKSLQSLYFDIAGDVLPAGIEILLTLTDENHLLFGGDFPYTPKEMITGKVQALMQHERLQPMLDKLMYKNAEILFAGR